MTHARTQDLALTGLCIGTMVETTEGPQPVDWLRPGDQVLTLDHGYQPLVWVGRSARGTSDDARPLTLPAGALGDQCPEQALHLAPGHYLLLRTPLADLYFGDPDVFVPVIDIATEAERVLQTDHTSDEPRAPYVHLMCAQHEILLAEGLWVESFFPDENTLPHLPPKAREEIARLERQHKTPALRTRLTLKPTEALILRPRSAVVKHRMVA